MNLLQAFNFLNTITEGGADYQKSYIGYLEDHNERVKKFSSWLQKNLPELFTDIDYNIDIDDFNELIDEHDISKYDEEEFEPYAQYFYGDKEETLEYKEAWKHHWMNNEHHPEYWLGEDMPYIYILEMICDWGSFSIEKGDMKEIINYYYSEARDDEEKNLSDNTKKIIEEILSKIESVVEGGK